MKVFSISLNRFVDKKTFDNTKHQRDKEGEFCTVASSWEGIETTISMCKSVLENVNKRRNYH